MKNLTYLLGSVCVLFIQIILCIIQYDFLGRFETELRDFMPRLGDYGPEHPAAQQFDTWTFVVPGFAQWVLVPLGFWLAFRFSKGQDKIIPIQFAGFHIALCLLSWYYCGVSFSMG